MSNHSEFCCCKRWCRCCWWWCQLEWTPRRANLQLNHRHQYINTQPFAALPVTQQCTHGTAINPLILDRCNGVDLSSNKGVRVIEVSHQTVQAVEKLVLPSIFDTRLSSFMIWNLLSYQTTVQNERMRHLWESKHILTPTNFQGVKTPITPGSTPLAGSWALTGLWPVDPAVSSDVYTDCTSYNVRTRVNKYISSTICFWVYFRVYHLLIYLPFYFACFLLIVWHLVVHTSATDWLDSHTKTLYNNIFRCSMFHQRLS